MLRTMLRPQWLAFSGLVIVIVAVFLMLGRWQLGAAFKSSSTAVESSEYTKPVALGELLQPEGWLSEEGAARSVELQGFFVPGDFVVVAGRLQNTVSGFWVVGHFAVTDDGVNTYSGSNAVQLPGIPVALGWAQQESNAHTAIAELDGQMRASLGSATKPAHLAATLEAGQDPQVAREGDPEQILTMSPGQLVNTWGEAAASYYPAWLLTTGGVSLPNELQTISVVPIDDSLQIDLLNIFYALEWLVFAVFAIYLWWRMVRDDYLATLAQRSDDAIAQQVRRQLLLELADRRCGTPEQHALSGEPDRQDPPGN